MPVGVVGTGHWAYGFQGKYWVEDPPKPRGGGGGTNDDKVGGGHIAPPTRTRRGSRGGSSGTNSDRVGSGGGGGRRSGGGGGISAARQAAIDAAARRLARQAKRVARLAAIAQKRAEINAAAVKRAERMAQELAAREAAREQIRQSIVQRLAILKAQRDGALRAGNQAAARAADGAIQSAEAQLLEVNASGSKDRLGASRAHATAKLHALTVSAGQPPEEDILPRKLRTKIKPIVDLTHNHKLAVAYQSLNKAGTPRRQAELKAAIRTELGFQTSHPEFFNTDNLNWLGEELIRHQETVQKGYDEIAEKVEKDVERLKDKSLSAGQRNAALKRINKVLDDQDTRALIAQMKGLYGPEGRTNVKGTKIPNTQKGLLWEYKLGIERAYDAAQKRQDEIMFGTGLGAGIQALGYKIGAEVAYATAEATKHRVADALTGQPRMQSVEERLSEMYQARGVSQETANKIGQERIVDFTQRLNDAHSNPVLYTLYTNLLSYDVKTNQDLKGPFGEDLLESKIIPGTRDDVMKAWRNSSLYAVPGEAEGIYDPDNYSRVDGTEYFTFADGTTAKPGDPIPPGHPEPLWGAVGHGDIFQGAPIIGNPSLSWQYEDAKNHYEDKKSQDIEDEIRAELQRPDPGWLGEAFKVGLGGEITGYSSGVAGAAALEWRKYIQADTGYTWLHARRDEQGNITDQYDTSILDREPERFTGYTETLVVDTKAHPSGDLGLDLLAGIMPVRTTIQTNKQTEGHGFTTVIGVPFVGPVEFSFQRSPEISADIAAREADVQKAIETGDWAATGRVLGMNEPIQFGNMAGAYNFTYAIIVDPTNWIPGVTIGKKGLAAVRAAVLAGKAPPAGLSRLAAIWEAVVPVIRADTKLAEEISGSFSSWKKVSHLTDDVEALAALRREAAGVDMNLSGARRVDVMTDNIMKNLGLKKLGVDRVQIRVWVEAEAENVLRHRGWLIYSQTEEALDIIKRAEDIAKVTGQSSDAIKANVALRNRQLVATAEAEGKRARSAQAVKKAREDNFERQALDLSRKETLETIEKRAVDPAFIADRKLYERARELGRERRGIVAGQVGIASGPQKTAVQRMADLEAAKQARRAAQAKVGKAERDAALKAEDLRVAQEARVARAQRAEKVRRERVQQARDEQAMKDAGLPGRKDRMVSRGFTGPMDVNTVRFLSNAETVNGHRVFEYANSYLDAAVRGPNKAASEAFIRKYMADDFNTLAVSVANAATKIDAPELLEELFTSPLARLYRRVYPPYPIDDLENTLRAGTDFLNTVDVAGVFRGVTTVDEQLKILEALVTRPDIGVLITAKNATLPVARALDDLAKGIAYAQLTGEQMDLVIQVTARLAKSSNGIYISRLLRERINKELDFLGYNDASLAAGRIVEATDLKSAAGRPVAAQNVGGEIRIDKALMREKFDAKAWTTPPVLDDGSSAAVLPGGAFSTYDEWEAFVIRHERLHTNVKRVAGETRGAYETRINDLALAGGVRQVPLFDTDPAMIATVQAKTIFNAMGQSETAWLQTRIKRNMARINNSATHPAERAFLLADNTEMRTALKDIGIRKAGGSYKIPRVRWDDSQAAAKAKADEVMGVLPPNTYAYYGENLDQLRVELSRGVYVKYVESPSTGTREAFHAEIAGFDMRLWDDLNDFVGEAIRKVQGRRRSAIGLKDFNKSNPVTDLLMSVTDKDARILAAKRKAIDEFMTARGLAPLSDDAYDRIRTLVEPHRGRARRGALVMEDAKAQGGDYTQTFTALRQAKTDENAVENIAWTLNQNPGMTPDEAVELFRNSWYNDGRLRKKVDEITETDRLILGNYFTMLTGADVADANAVKNALQAFGTKPPFDQHFRFAAHQEKTGAWSKRTAEAVVKDRAWSIDEEREWFMNRYGEAPAWTTHPDLMSGDALVSREKYYAVMKETGSYDDRLQVERILGAEDNTDFMSIIHGNPSKGIKRTKDWEVERKWAIERYGDLVYDSTTKQMIQMPWLMTPDEVVLWGMKNGDKATDIIYKADEVAAVRKAIAEITAKEADAWIAAAKITDSDLMVVPSTVLHEIAYSGMRRLAATTPWRGFLRKQRAENFFEMWGAVWRALVVSNPAFTISNVPDALSKGAWFRMTHRFASRPGPRAKRVVSSLDAIGIDATGYFYAPASRSFFDRMGVHVGKDGVRRVPTSWGVIDKIGAMFDLAATGIARNVLPRVENGTKEYLAQCIFQGLWDDVSPALLDEIGLTVKDAAKAEEMAEVIIAIRTKNAINQMFPTMQNAAVAERLLNKVFPFISYNIKNKILWTGEVVEHPWLADAVLRLQDGLAEENRRKWKEEFGEDALMPENLTHQIEIGDTGFYLDIGNFTDAARGASPLLGKGFGSNVGQLLNTFFRPLPAQRALFDAMLFKFGFGGRYRNFKVYDADGLWDGKSFETRLVEPGTPWGDRPLDIMLDYLWPADIAHTVDVALKDGNLTEADKIRIIGDLILFSEFGEPSRYSVLTQQYYGLADKSEAAARAWLDTADGKELRDLWNQHYDDPTITGFDEMKVPFPEGVVPSPKDLRKRWLLLQSPDTRQLFFDSWDELERADLYWNAAVDDPTLDDAGREHMWTLRRTWYTQFYHNRPYLWQYGAMGQTPEEFSKFTTKMFTDDKVSRFFAAFSWDLKPEDPKEAAIWEQQRIDVLKANPDIFDALEARKTGYDRMVDRINESWDRSIRMSRYTEHLRQAGYERDRPEFVNTANRVQEFFGLAFSAEAFGRDVMPDAKDQNVFSLRPDMLGLKLKKALGDPVATKEALYAERMAALARKAKGADGKWDPLKWHKILDANPDLRALYFERNPEKQESWKQDGKYLQFWERFGRLADGGHWDAAWESWDEAPAWIREKMRENNPKKFFDLERTSRYSAYMGHWVGLFDTAGGGAAMAYFNSLPGWVKDRYYSNHPGQSFSTFGGRGSAYVDTLDRMFNLIDGGNWDAAEKVWRSAPAWMRNRYYGNNPDSTLFRGGSGGGGFSGGGSGFSSGGSTGRGMSLSDSNYRKYVGMMKTWVGLLKDDKEDKAQDYFRSLPKWAQDFYLAAHPDQALMREDDKMLGLLESYFTANKAAQKAMLANSPKLRQWLHENDSKAARMNSIEWIYSNLPDDPWLRRVFREKYPEIFSEEAQGKRDIKSIMDTLGEHPDLIPAWQKWYAGIVASLEEAMKWMHARPKSPVPDHELEKHVLDHHSLSAAEVNDSVQMYTNRLPQLNKRMPKIE